MSGRIFSLVFSTYASTFHTVVQIGLDEIIKGGSKSQNTMRGAEEADGRLEVMTELK
jgi:hypothetical protein